MFGRSAKVRLAATATLALLASTATVAAPVVEATSDLPVTTVDREQLDKLPTGRRLEDLIRTCPSTTIPTVSRRADILIDGKPSIDLNCIQPADIEMIEVFKAHNDLRAQYGASPLAWDRILELSAGEYVGQLARTGAMVHAPREGRGTVRENISQGLPNYRARQLMDSWLSERRYFTPGIFPNVSTTGDWYQVGHLTQILWPTTAVFGCARGLGAGSSWLVCRYDPGGNKDGKAVGIPVQTQQVAGADYNMTGLSVLADGPGQVPVATDTLAYNTGTETGRRASLFDLGIYGVGAWTSNWFDPDGSLGGPTDELSGQCPPVFDAYDSVLYHGTGPTLVSDSFQFYFGAENILDAPAPTTGSDLIGRYFYPGCRLDF